jgi:tripartite-type tricarboxylate transporter receptor subunit TctC
MTRTSLVVVSGRSEFKTLDALVQAGRSGQQLQFASSGVGSAAHLLGERFARASGMRSALHVPYKGSADAMNDLLAGRVAFMFDAVSAMGPHIASGKLSAIAVTGAQRSPQLPQVPSIAELGYPAMVSHAWAGLLAPAKTPRPIIDRMSREVAAVLAQPDLKARLAAISTDTVGSTPAELAAFIEQEAKVNGDVIRELKISLD